MTVGDLLNRCSSRELSEWQAYFRIENEDRDKQNLANKSRAEVKKRTLR
jgi:hypothetical protein